MLRLGYNLMKPHNQIKMWDQNTTTATIIIIIIIIITRKNKKTASGFLSNERLHSSCAHYIKISIFLANLFLSKPILALSRPSV
jgi:hypothetical protein